jgi:hypothetical protein
MHVRACSRVMARARSLSLALFTRTIHARVHRASHSHLAFRASCFVLFLISNLHLATSLHSVDATCGAVFSLPRARSPLASLLSPMPKPFPRQPGFGFGGGPDARRLAARMLSWVWVG